MCSLKIFANKYQITWIIGTWEKKKNLFLNRRVKNRKSENNACIQETRSSLELFLLLERFRIVQYYPVPYENEEVLKSENPSSLGH